MIHSARRDAKYARCDSYIRNIFLIRTLYPRFARACTRTRAKLRVSGAVSSGVRVLLFHEYMYIWRGGGGGPAFFTSPPIREAVNLRAAERSVPLPFLHVRVEHAPCIISPTNNPYLSGGTTHEDLRKAVKLAPCAYRSHR